MQKFDTIKLEIKNNCAYLTLNRPEIHNAFNDRMIAEIIEALSLLKNSKEARLLILNGEGKSFCAGADLNWMKKMKDYTLEENVSDSLQLEKMFHTLNTFELPVVGLIHGAALGGGAGLVAVCDHAVAIGQVKIGFTEVKLGLIPAVISPYVIKKIGESHARASFLSGALFTPEKAMQMNLIHDHIDEKQLDAFTEKLISQYLSAGPKSAKVAKKLIKDVSVDIFNHESQRMMTAELIAQRRISEEGQEGMSALLEKRKPNWQN